jgi:anti-anti-sigma factor
VRSQRNAQLANTPSTTRLPARTPAAAGKAAPRDEIRVLNPTLRNGFAQVPSPVMRARGLSHQAVRLYALLLDYSWSDNACFPGQARLAADLDLKSVRSVYSILSELRDYGLIDWHRRPNNSNVYLILDFTQVQFVDSQGLAFLISLYKFCYPQGCTLMIRGANPHVNSLIRLTRMNAFIKSI